MLTLTYQGRRYALEEPTEPLLTRDSRERMESRAVLDVRRGVLEAVLHWFFFFLYCYRGTPRTIHGNENDAQSFSFSRFGIG